MEKTLTVYQIVQAHLEREGLEGLWNEVGECACEVHELGPCGQMDQDCQAGVKIPCPPECGEHEWHIGPREEDPA